MPISISEPVASIRLPAKLHPLIATSTTNTKQALRQAETIRLSSREHSAMWHALRECQTVSGMSRHANRSEECQVIHIAQNTIYPRIVRRPEQQERERGGGGHEESGGVRTRGRPRAGRQFCPFCVPANSTGSAQHSGAKRRCRGRRCRCGRSSIKTRFIAHLRPKS